ncbi:hypothetical protein Hanom_Chr01g00063711 [Helianthus anomalus]
MLQTVNKKLSAMNKLLTEENDRLQKQVSQVVCENIYMHQQLHTICLYDVFDSWLQTLLALSFELVNMFANAGDTAVEIAGTTTFWVRAFFLLFHCLIDTKILRWQHDPFFKEWVDLGNKNLLYCSYFKVCILFVI